MGVYVGVCDEITEAFSPFEDSPVELETSIEKGADVRLCWPRACIPCRSTNSAAGRRDELFLFPALLRLRQGRLPTNGADTKRSARQKCGKAERRGWRRSRPPGRRPGRRLTSRRNGPNDGLSANRRGQREIDYLEEARRPRRRPSPKGLRGSSGGLPRGAPCPTRPAQRGGTTPRPDVPLSQKCRARVRGGVAMGVATRRGVLRVLPALHAAILHRGQPFGRPEIKADVRGRRGRPTP